MIKMIRQLDKSLAELKKAQKIQGNIMNGLISKLPKNKRREAVKLLDKAKKGKINLSELMGFVGNIPDKDKETLKNSVNDLNNR